VRAIIFVPENANPVKVESMRALGAEIVFHGRDFDDAREQCEKQAAEHGYRYIHSGNEPDLIAGVGTYTVEIVAERPDRLMEKHPQPLHRPPPPAPDYSILRPLAQPKIAGRHEHPACIVMARAAVLDMPFHRALSRT